jgi:hypothetical protein
MTRTEAVALRRTWKARAGTLTRLHHHLFVERINPRRSTKHFLCMDCGGGLVRRFTPSAEHRPCLSSRVWAGTEKYQNNPSGYMTLHSPADSPEINNRAEGNAPLTVQALSETLRR